MFVTAPNTILHLRIISPFFRVTDWFVLIFGLSFDCVLTQLALKIFVLYANFCGTSTLRHVFYKQECLIFVPMQ